MGLTDEEAKEVISADKAIDKGEKLFELTEEQKQVEKINPETLAQASRIPGVSPSDINVMLVLLGR